MKLSRRSSLKLIGAASAVLVAPPLWADPVMHEVQMLSRDPENPKKRFLFSPQVLQVAPGDSVHFVATDRGHNSVSDPNMMPDGAMPWAGQTSHDIEVTLDIEGTYGYYCNPHRGLGMVGLILVGDFSSNFDAAKAAEQPRKPREVYAELFAIAQGMRG